MKYLGLDSLRALIRQVQGDMSHIVGAVVPTFEDVYTRLESGGAPLALWHTLNVADSYDLGEETDIAAWLAAHLNLNWASYAGGSVVAPQPLAIEVGDYTWSAPDAQFRMTATADVSVMFPDGSRLTKSAVRFYGDYSVPGRVYAVKLDDGASPVDTGLTMDYSYTFEVEGHAPDNNAATLLGAYTSTSERTTLRLMGVSNKAQSMWPGNNETTNIVSGINFNQMFRYVENAEQTVFQQGGTTYTRSYSGTASGTGAASIYLLGESNAVTDSYRYGILRSARIYDGDGTLLRFFQPAARNGAIVFVDLVEDREYVPGVGALVEVTA